MKYLNEEQDLDINKKSASKRNHKMVINDDSNTKTQTNNKDNNEKLIFLTRTKIKCHKCIKSAWSIWYCLLIIILQSYVIYQRINDMKNLVDNIKSPSINDNSYYKTLFTEFIIRLIFLILSIIFIFVYIITKFRNIGQYSNDSFKFGRDYLCEKNLKKRFNFSSGGSRNSSSSNRKRLNIKRLFTCCWRHFMPFSSLAHLISIFLLIITQIVFEEVTTQKMPESGSVVPTVVSTTTPSVTSIDNLTSINDTRLNRELAVPITDYSNLIDFVDKNKIELISYSLAIITLYVSYSSVFWLTNRILSFILSFVGVFTAIEQLFQLYSLNYLLKYHLEQQRSDSKSQIRSASNNSNQPNYLLTSKFTILFMYFLCSFLVYLSLIPIYVFIYTKYKDKYKQQELLFKTSALKQQAQQQQQLTPNTSTSCYTTTDTYTTTTTTTITSNYTGTSSNSSTSSTCFYNYCTHLIAATQLLLICASKIPFCYDYIILYDRSYDYGLMISIIVNVVHTMILLLVWFLFTLKTEWNMNIQYSFTVCHWLYHNDHDLLFSLPINAYSKPNQHRQQEQDNKNQQDSSFVVSNRIITEPPPPPQQQQQITISNPTNTTNSIVNTPCLGYLKCPTDEMMIAKLIQDQHINLGYINSNTNLNRVLPPFHHHHHQQQTPITQQHVIDKNNDFIVNSEMYRNEIRKSIRNVLQPQNNYVRATTLTTSTITSTTGATTATTTTATTDSVKQPKVVGVYSKLPTATTSTCATTPYNSSLRSMDLLDSTHTQSSQQQQPPQKVLSIKHKPISRARPVIYFTNTNSNEQTGTTGGGGGSGSACESRV